MKPDSPTGLAGERSALLVGGCAAMLASTCCLGQLVLVAVALAFPLAASWFY